MKREGDLKAQITRDKNRIIIDAFECEKCGKVPETVIDLNPFKGQFVRIWLDEDGTYSLDPNRNHYWQIAEFQVPKPKRKASLNLKDMVIHRFLLPE